MEKQRTLSKSIIILGLFSFITSLSGESTNLALPTISRALTITNNEATWIVQIGLITTTILLVAFGHLGDLLSKEFIFLIGGVLFTIGSLINGLSPNFTILLLGRVVQAIGSAMIMRTPLDLRQSIPLRKHEGLPWRSSRCSYRWERSLVPLLAECCFRHYPGVGSI
ncbi:MFS transporter [Enterococcus gilvus]|uniref:Major facilitator superfamily (MFS) profile domain-containing protein n=1 Tax=Enterococcus gilvus ATCC BAA-350 TaxID=1158614 RepID=R2XUF3_9ENTE|nr:MFS transporter [Enterococcus gilvus]EOI53602.1 hypothetical protein UKC_03554 [Enterococcus gilvus ATCC BAA-350]EOW81123.1 hypothetical protein I592_00408 [Enterococcus gilvus ATCC BAA-350]